MEAAHTETKSNERPAGEATQDMSSLVLIPGLAADARIFAAQQRAFPDLTVPHWPQPFAEESFSHYCERMSHNFPCHGTTVLGGASFGGIVALEMTRYIQPRCVVLLGSIRHPRELAWPIQMCRPFRHGLRCLPIRTLQTVSKAIRVGRSWWPITEQIASQFRDADPTLLRWSMKQLLSWPGPPSCTCPIYHIHGNRDRLMPVRLTQPDVVIRGAGHFITCSHPTEVNNYLSHLQSM